MDCGFRTFNLMKVAAGWNSPSERPLRIMEKLGMVHEAALKKPNGI
jgi:RimJ/RimL family protein N-acetyltransferase